MTDVLRLILAVLASLFKSRAELEAENLVLRQQINVLSRRMPKRPALTNIDRLLFVWGQRVAESTALFDNPKSSAIAFFGKRFMAGWTFEQGQPRQSERS
jgi:hypothetical protein